ncbi:MAG: hypothetical protein CVV63_04125 [Tenericutes bacterium HGW-Tenericutes-8]|nr:MAG: hypothetical protein CVV63_04125 [Tenericutes bacterium HGW-Tenericutes-8]
MCGVDIVLKDTTYPAIEAIKYGFGIELDTNILKDGTVVCFHDRNLKRMCGVDIVLKDTTYPAIEAIKIKDSDETILKLEDVLTYINGRVPVMIELKPFGKKRRHAKTVYQIIKDYPYPISVQSYNPYIILWFKHHAKEITRGQISEFFRNDSLPNLSKWLMRSLLTNQLTKPHFINYGIMDLPNKYVDKQKKKGVIIFGYAAKNQKQLDFMRKQYDNAVFEDFMPKQRKV